MNYSKQFEVNITRKGEVIIILRKHIVMPEPFIKTINTLINNIFRKGD
jgi:hypothetical protein